VFDIAFLRSIPNMVVMMPKDENELRHMMKTALDYSEGPIAVRYPRTNGIGVEMDEVLHPIPIGTWEVVRQGDTMAILALGPMVQVAEQAASMLQQQGLSVRVINARFVKPLDEAMLFALAKEGLDLITIEEGVLLGGMGSAILEFYAKHSIYSMRVHNMAIPDYFVEHGSQTEQRKEVGLTADNVVAQVKALLPRKKQRA
jgi:1-deoxy-D-xylulose-5-phosphate synthase